MLGDQQIANADLEDWRKLGQGLHARFLPSSFMAAARFLVAVGEMADEAGHAPQVRLDARFVDLKLISEDAIYRDEDGVEHQVEWVTQRDVELARRISEVAPGPRGPCRPVVDHHDRAGPRHRARRGRGAGVVGPVDRQR